MTQSTDPRRAGSRAARWTLGIYVVTVVGLTVAGAATIRSAAEADAPIGGALILGFVGLLGLPWSLAVFVTEDGLDGDVASAAIYALLAVLNAVLLFWFARAVTRRHDL